MNAQRNRIIKYSAPVILLALFILWFVVESRKPQSCTIFTASQGETVLFGDNFDQHQANLLIGFYPDSSRGYGSVHFGFRYPDGSINFDRAVNNQGLAWSINSIPRSKLNPHPERPYSHADDNYLRSILKQATTVEEAISTAGRFDFGDSMAFQIHIADASGDAVVIGPGPDGEIAYTRKPIGDGYLLSTNFNLATPDKGPKSFRYPTGTSMLDQLSAAQELTPDFASQVLQAVKLNNLTTYTLLSNVIDLKNGNIYIYYMSQYDQAVELNLVEELAKGERIVELRELFSAETVDAGDSAYQRFETRFTITKITAVVAALTLIGGACVLVIRKLTRR